MEPGPQITFGPFQLDLLNQCLWRDEQSIQLTPKAFAVLYYLVEHAGRLVTKEELLSAVWPETYVSDAVLKVSIGELRKVLGDDAKRPQFIETAHRRGYRFIGRAPAEGDESGTGKGRHDSLVGTRKPRWRRAVLVAPALLAGAAAAIYYLMTGDGKTTDSIAVLPFVNATGEPDTEYLSDGITESLINTLSRLPQLHVVPRTLVFRYKGQKVDPQTAGRELGVRSVLTGRLTQRGDSLHVQTELTDVASVSQLWGEQYRRKLSDILVVQDDIATEISERLRIRLTGEEKKRLTRRYTENTEAYQLYLKGYYFFYKGTTEGRMKAIEHFQQAIEKDPIYAPAYSGLAVSLSNLRNAPPKDTYPKAREAAIRAVEIDGSLGEAQAVLAWITYWYDWDSGSSEARVRRAFELDPNYALAHVGYAVLLSSLDRGGEAIAEIEKAQQLDPTSVSVLSNAGRIFYQIRNYDEAIKHCKNAVDMDASYEPAHRRLGDIYLKKGMDDRALEEFLKAEELSGRSPEDLAELKDAYARSGWRGFWQNQLEWVTKQAKRRYIPAYTTALLYARLQNKDRAFDWLEKTYEERDGALLSLKVDPNFDGLRSDPRFGDLLTRMSRAEQR